MIFEVVVEKEMRRRRWGGEKERSGGAGKRGELRKRVLRSDAAAMADKNSSFHLICENKVF